MRRSIVTLCTVALALSVGALGAAPAGAGSSCAGNNSSAPDGRIKVDDSSFQGRGIYPQEEILKITLAPGTKVTFTMRWKNVSDATANIRLAFLVSLVDPGFSRTRYFVDGVNVTNQFAEHPTVVFRDVAPGRSTPVLEVVIKNRTATSGDEKHAGFAGRYGGAPFTACDALIGSIELT